MGIEFLIKALLTALGYKREQLDYTILRVQNEYFEGKILVLQTDERLKRMEKVIYKIAEKVGVELDPVDFGTFPKIETAQAIKPESEN